MDYTAIAFIAALNTQPMNIIQDYTVDCLHRAAIRHEQQCQPAAWFAALDELRDRRRREIEDIFYSNYIETGVWPLSGGEK